MFELKLCNFPCFISFRLLEIHFCSLVFCSSLLTALVPSPPPQLSFLDSFCFTVLTIYTYSWGYRQCGCQSSISAWRILCLRWILSQKPRCSSLSLSLSLRLSSRLGQPLNALGALLLSCSAAAAKSRGRALNLPYSQSAICCQLPVAIRIGPTLICLLVCRLPFAIYLLPFAFFPLLLAN